MDRKDARILHLLQRDCTLTSEQIGQEIGMSPTGVVRRRNRLRERRIVTAEIALVDAKAVGYPERVFLLGSFNKADPEERQRFLDTIRDDPHVVRAMTVLGDTDFLVEVVARSGEAYRQFLGQYQAAFPGIRNVSSLTVFEEVKHGHAIPVDAIEAAEESQR